MNSKFIFEYALSNAGGVGAENSTNASSSSSSSTSSVGGSSSNSNNNNNNNEVEFQKHILLFESRLQNALKTLIKLWLSAKDPKQKAELYKKMYMETLNIRKVAGSQHVQKTSVNVLAQQFANLLERLTQLERIHANALNNNSNNNYNNSKTN